jgi:phage-related protein
MYALAYNIDVRRHWTSFNRETTNREFSALPTEDRVGLFEAMKLYRIDAGIGYVVKSYGKGLMMIKPKDGQGRCLFFTTIETQGVQELVALLAYKKEGQKMPKRIKNLALERMADYQQDRK